MYLQENITARKNCLIRVIGGTILMKEGPDGLAVMTPAEAGNILAGVDIGHVEISFSDKLSDSSDLNLEWLIREYEFLKEASLSYGSVVVVTGTDTLAYFVAFLDQITKAGPEDAVSYPESQMMEKIILTAAMQPLVIPGSDGYTNLSAATGVAKTKRFQAGVYFTINNGEVHRAEGARKIHSSAIKAFVSENGEQFSGAGNHRLVFPDLVCRNCCIEVMELHENLHIPTLIDLLKVSDGLVFSPGTNWQKVVSSLHFKRAIDQFGRNKLLANTAFETLENVLAVLVCGKMLGENHSRMRVRFRNTRSMGLPEPGTGVNGWETDLSGKAFLQVYTITPYSSAQAFRVMLGNSQNLLLKGYGMGNGPHWLLQLLEDVLVSSGKEALPENIFMTTQCAEGEVDLAEYAAGTGYARLGVRATESRSGEELYDSL